MTNKLTTVTDLATPDPSRITSLSNPQKHALYTLIADKVETIVHTASQGNSKAEYIEPDELRKILKELFDE